MPILPRFGLSFRRKGSDESRQSRFQRTVSEPRSPNSSPSSSVSASTQEDHRGSIGSLHPSSIYADSRRPSDSSPNRKKPDPGSLGLSTIHVPEDGHKADIVFIHGLGGASRRTWSKNEDPELFWPLKFLPLEPDVCRTRIFTFGYNANFRAAGKLGVSVLDFAKDLLYDLKYAKHDQKEGPSIGKVPLIFVVHSMGGLIVKEAYMQGQNDPEYESIIKAISAIIFLATPHRGTNLADLLDRILRSSIVSSSKQYVSELAKNSYTLQKLNEQFRHIAPRLDIVSFYETQSTSIGLKNSRIMILEKDSSVLGYPGETSKALDADHHNVCKYSSPADPNYIIVRNALAAIIGKITLTSGSNKSSLPSRKESSDLKSLLAITQLPDIDYIFFRDQWAQGTNHWFFEEPAYLEWLQARESTPFLLWVYGGAAAGKSVLSSFIINKLVEDGASCQYFFIRFGDRKKQTLSLLLRSIAYQIALCVPIFAHKVLQLVDAAVDFETADPRTIWERVFKLVLFNMEGFQPLYWIIDGLDEADDPRALIRLLPDITSSNVPIKILLVGRRTGEITASFDKVQKKLDARSISIEGHLDDMCSYVNQELSMSGTTELREAVARRVVEGAQNNFLWVRLAVDKLNLCHTEADVELALQQIPTGMEALYDRMALSIAQRPSATEKALACTILQCVTCSLRNMTVTELSLALHEDVSKILDLQRSIVDLCGGFVVIDNGGNVSMLHQTAREYLLNNNDRPFHVDKDGAHAQIFRACMRCLMAPNLRAKLKSDQKPEFLDYAATSWSTHLASVPLHFEQVFEVLHKFLIGSWVLTWIHTLAAGGKLRVLIQASKHLSKYSAKQTEYQALHNKEGHHIVRQEVLGSWSEDFVKIVGKFGTILRRNPESIYRSIPPFCPPNSAIYQQFGTLKDKSLVVSGLSSGNWDDSLARIPFGFGTFASSILAAGSLIAVLFSSGSVILYESSAFEEAAASAIKHGERVYRMELNSNGTLLATYGYLTTKVWETSTGICRTSIKNIQSRPRPLAMLLAKNSSTLVVGMDDRSIRSLDLDQAFPVWQVLAKLEEPELEGHFLNSANCMALNNDGNLAAVAYRGHPLSAWEIAGPVHIGHCWRQREEVARGEVIEAVWHPHYPEILGLYIEGVVFKWRPYEDETEEMSAGASRLATSRDGNLFATGDVRGTVKVYTTADFCLLYQLASEDTVLGMAFSPDLRRFYDIRGHYGNAWEPNALMKFAEQRGKDLKSGGETGSFAQNSMASENWSGRVDSITVLAVSPLGRLYCYGTEEGTVRLYDSQRGRLADLHISKSFLSTEQISWSKDGRFLCFSDSSKRVMVKSITTITGSTDPVVNTEAEISMTNSIDGPILQLLFHPKSSQVLVISTSTICVLSIASSSLTGLLKLPVAGCRWVAHPQDPTLVIGVAPNTIQVLDWELAKHETYHLEYPDNTSRSASPQGSPDQRIVDRVLVTRDKKHVFVQLSTLNQKAKGKTFLYFATTACSLSTASMGLTPVIDKDQTQRTITPFVLPHSPSSHITLALSFLPGEKLVFLSRTFSVCTWRLPFGPIQSLSSSRPTTKSDSTTTEPTNSTLGFDSERSNDTNHIVDNLFNPLFALPGDWISRDALAICSIWGIERSFLCPRNGEVAIVRCAGLV